MKKRKRLARSVVCSVLAFTMLLGMAQPSFADETELASSDAADEEIVIESGIPKKDGASGDADTGSSRDDELSFKEPEETDAEADDSYGLYGGDDGSDSMGDPEKAGSSVGWDEKAGSDIQAYSSISGSSGLWWIDDYYVGESDPYDVYMTDDFSLKYQVEFHASEDLPAGTVELVIDATLGTYRSGKNIIPTDIGIPYGTPNDYTESTSSPFNYYYIDSSGNILTESEAKTADGVRIVIWNYRDIESGSNAMFQVLYKSLDVMQIYDMTQWSLEVSASVDLVVDGQETTETVDGNTLTGTVDTQATLTSVTKKAYTASGVSYTPELYTETQVKGYISGSIPEPYASSFSDYIYIVWKVTLKGSATQAYEITIDDATFSDSTGNGSVVGFKNISSSTTSGLSCSVVSGTSPSITYTSSSARSFSAEFYVVTAYDADTYETDTAIENDVTVTVHPADGYDKDTTKSASATTTWGEYEWRYLGDTIGIKKYVDTTGTKTSKTYRAYETLYEINMANGEDTGEFTFHTRSTDRGYSFTHHVDGSGIGDYIEGTYYTTTTVDDALYIYPNGGTTPSRMLTKDDYYFSSVKAVTTDNGYDVWEDATAGAAACDDVDRDVYVYAMYYEQGPDADKDGWEYVGKTAFSTGGTMTYTFSASDLERQPYRVKVVHSTINYATYCTITLGVTLRGDSPIIAGIMDEYGDSLTSLKIENLSGVAGQAYGQDDRSETVYVNGELYHDGDYFQDTRVENGNYSEKDTVTGVTLEDFTRDLYGTILMRDNSYSTLTRLEETAAAYKSVTTENDTANSRVLADYTLTAYEAYYVTGSSTCDALRNAGISLPARNDVSYYDLLPYGMRFNANAAVTAGRISAMNSSGTWKTNSGAWDKAGVTVTVDESDVIANWNNTGREMVIFHIHYDGDDASGFYDVSSSDDDLWYQGFGVAFQAYYDWTDMDTVDAEYNIAAYVAENVTDESRQLLGRHDSDVWKDDGSASLSSRYEPFRGVSDLNGDGTTGLYTNMYCSVSTTTDVATSSADNITKKVRADDDAVAEYGTTAAVGNGRGYTYEISLKNATGGILSGIVIFDRLEYSVEDGRNGVETRSGSVFSGLADEDIDSHWTGTFNGLTMTALDDLGIGYTIYYNTSRNAEISSEDGTTKPSAVLTSGNGWYTSDSFGGSLSDVKAIAVDLGDFEMDQETSFSFQIHMTAPDGSDCTYALNNPSYYSVNTDMTGDRTSATDIGDTVRVELGESGTVEVEKEFAEGYEVPAAMAGTKFTYAIMRGDSLLANQEYMVYEYSNGRWVSTGVVSATDINGRFTLRAGEKAVFSDLVDVDSVTVTEVETPLWQVTNEGSERSTGSSGSVSYLFINKYRSPVYLYKTVETTDLASDEELEEATFTFLIEVDRKGDGSYEPLADSEILYVDKAVTDGSSPAILKKGTTDSEGKISIGIGDIIAFFPEDSDGNTIGVSYRITEVGSSESWICENDTVAGTTSDYGTKATVTNYYRYRALIITKDLSDYDHDIDSCEYEWTFRITDSSGSPVTGSSWYMIDSDNNYTGTGGTLDSNGEFTVSGAGSGHRIVVTGLVMNEKYTVTEAAYDEELFETVNGGTASATMPSYSITRKSTITNEYLLRDLKVQKIALSKDPDADVSSAEFTYTLTDGDGRTVAGAEYTIENGDGTVYSTDGSGRFTLHGGQTAVFDDIGYIGDVFIVSEQADETYSRVLPADNADGKAILDNDGGSILFINGNFDDIVYMTKRLNGLDDAGEAYVGIVRGDNTADTLEGDEESRPYTVDVTFGVYDGDSSVTDSAGSLITYTDSNSDYQYAYIKITASGEVTLRSYNGGLMTESLAPYDHIYIAEIGSCTVKVFESDDMRYVILGVTDEAEETIGTDEIISTGNVMSGSARSGGSITLINDISSAHKESEIYKLMSDSSDEVMTGSRITFRVEIYDASSGAWSPASGIKYITMDGYHGNYDTSGCYATSGVLTTGSDGKIVLTKSDDGYPYIRFTENEVYANVYDDAKDGALRIVEVSSGTDGEWGIILGYDGDGWINGPALDVVYGDTIVDAGDSSMMFEVEKIVEGGDDNDEFTFTLVHVISAAASPVTSIEDVNDSEAGSNVYYIIYDSETDSRISDGYTDSNGRFTLKSGRYARFFVPDGTVWLVYEGIRTGYVLADVIANSEEAENASIIDGTTGAVQDATDARATGRITLTLTDSETGKALSGATFNLYRDGTLIAGGLVTDEGGQIIVSSLTDGEYYFIQTEASDGYRLPDNVRTDSVVIEGLTRPQDYEIGFSNEEDKVVVKYAVKIWGIYTDEYSEDEGATSDIASLTFGPALGADHLDSYISCGSDTCIHNLSWGEIIQLCEDNHGNRTALESLFGSCLENGCTKAVELTPNDTLFNMTTVDNMLAKGYSGDGVSCLYYLVNVNHNYYWNNSYTGYSSSDPANIYSRSRIRTTLNGNSTNIDARIEAGGTNYYYSDSYPLLDESSCLLSCFPAGLKDAIVSRAIDNTGSPSSGSYKGYDTTTTYDRLWLPSMKEVGLDYSYDDGAGSNYGIASSNSERVAYEFSSTAASASSSRTWWSRSRSSNSLNYACHVNASGSANYGFVYYSYGLAPGFSIY